MKPLLDCNAPAQYKPDAALLEARERETARLVRLHCESVLNSPKTGRVGEPQALITSDIKAESEGQISLFG